MNAYEIVTKPNKRAKHTRTWIRFAESMEAATASAWRAIHDEYYGHGVLVSIRETADPRVAPEAR